MKTLALLPGVYRPRADTRLLADALADEPIAPGCDVLEVGTGSGALALLAARRGAAVTAVDVSRQALLTARINAWRSRLPLRLERGDAGTCTPGRRFDLVISNPPYVPAPHPRGRGAALAWDAGPDGRSVLDRLCRRAAGLLRTGGVMLLVHSELCGAATTVARLRDQGLRARVVRRADLPWGPVLTSRRDWLVQQGLVTPTTNREKLVVIRAEQP
ncbi:HemK2/MTQ2 family protein methyltransferase [Streptomyces sp. WAC06614]|uniref:HemK2/MTQ2 family protein methyltransferase n=1 Tax=Streptomyces sp. WAC06614 TaxID=2487416 RepID=UPI000F76FCF4|nr:HemK2/MTQ2 family protein methyltransferase [Streptomyces sp. WAC06614]RSS62882.1 methyltransferase domain-containing protein [Streptomyces sp. WAC06614]